MGTNYRWEKCYEVGGGVLLWAIVSDESAAKRSVESHLLVVNHEWEDSIGRPFMECELPQRIVALLNGDTDYENSVLAKVRTYKAPENNKPFSDEGIQDLEQQLMDAAKVADSSLLEMASLAIKRLRLERDATPT